MVGKRRGTGAGIRAAKQAVTCALAFALLQVSPGRALSVASPRYFIATQKTISSISARDGALAGRIFRAPFAFALAGGWGQALPAQGFASYSSFTRSLAKGSGPGIGTAVMYDAEKWPFTGIKERKDPIKYMGAFARSAQQAGYEVIQAPSPSLMLVSGSTCGALAGESEYQAFLRCRIGAHAAVGADILDVQAQQLERYPARYAAFVSAVASQARSVNPEIVIVAELSTSCAATAHTLYYAWKAVSGIADGIYLAMPQGQHPQAAVNFLGFVASTG